MDMIVVVPSRGRPANVERLIQAWKNTVSSLTSVLLHVVVDADDPRLEEYLAIPSERFLEVTVQSEDRGLGPVLNTAAMSDAGRSSRSVVIGNMGDDHVPRTKGWDRAVVRALKGKQGVAYGDDLLQGQRLPTAAFITSDLVRSLGFYTPPGLTHMFVDDFWLKLGRATDLVYLPDVVIEHVHPFAGKAETDTGYDEANSTAAADQEAWREYLLTQWPANLKKLQEAGFAKGTAKTVVYATIHPGTVSAWFHHSITDLLLFDGQANRRIVGKTFEHSGANLASARNSIVRTFLTEHDAEWLWLVDSDMVFPPDTLEALLVNADPEVAPIVGALCFGMNESRLFPTLYTFVAGENGVDCLRYGEYPENSMFQVGATGAACLLIHRSVLVAIGEKQFNRTFPWFQETEMAGKPCGEDITFCVRAGQLGFPIYVDTSVDVGHHKDQLLTAEMFREQRANV